jgi:hypothetical protein
MAGLHAVLDFTALEAASGRSGSEGSSAAGRVDSSVWSALASGEVDSMVLMRTMVRLSASRRNRPWRPDRPATARSQAHGEASRAPLELAALATDAARPGVLAQRVDHRAAHAALGKRLELDAPILVEAVGRVDEADDAVLHEVADVDRVRHRGCHAAGQSLDKGKTGNNAVTRSWRRAGSDIVFSLGAGRRARRQPLSQRKCHLGGTSPRAGRPGAVKGCKSLKR